MVWVILIFGGFFLIAIDRAFGLAFLLAGYGLIALIIGVAGVLGINLMDYEPVLDLLLITVFVPIAVRVSFLFHARSAEMPHASDGAMPGEFSNRNAEPTLRGILIASGLLKTFTTHFLTSGMLLISLSMLARWAPPDPLIMLAGVVAGSHLGGVVAEARGVTDPKKKIRWGLAGVVVAVLVSAGVFALSTYWWTMAVARGEAMPW